MNEEKEEHRQPRTHQERGVYPGGAAAVAVAREEGEERWLGWVAISNKQRDDGVPGFACLRIRRSVDWAQ